MTAADWIDDLERKAKAATPGPWEATQEGLTHPDGWEIDAPDGPVVVNECCGYRGSVGKTADAEFIAAANPATILRLIEDLRRTRSGARTLGRIIEQQNRDALDASGMHHVVDETGDGDWEVVWEALALLRPERDELAAKVAAVEALADEWERSEAYRCTNAGECPRCLAYQSAVIRVRAALAAPTDTTKET